MAEWGAEVVWTLVCVAVWLAVGFAVIYFGTYLGVRRAARDAEGGGPPEA